MSLIKRGVVLVFIILAAASAHAQQYGFEWIKPYQPYYKFKIGSTGVYRIKPDALLNAGINLNVIGPQRFQFFFRGREIPVYISGTTDGQFNNDDFIEFVAFKNDGALDSVLYAVKSWQPNTFNSLFTDTSVYYLSILPDTTIITPLRYSQVNDYNFAGLQPELYFMDTSVVAPTQEYLDGPDLANLSEKYISSEYENGEGWASERITWLTTATYQLKTPAAYASGPVPSIEYKIIGASNARELTGGVAANQHHILVDISPDNNSFTNLTNLAYKGYEVQKLSPAINYGLIGSSSTFVRLSVINDLNLASDYNALSYIWLKYARSYNLSNQTQKLFEVLHHRGNARSYIEMTNVGIVQNNAYVFDLTQRTRIATQFSGGTARFVINNTGKPHAVYLYDSTLVTQITTLMPVTFPIINPASNYDFVLVTSPAQEPAATNFASYRSNKFNVLKVYSEQLYDYYFYGNAHAYAIKQMMQHLSKTQTQAPAYLLLAGRGYQCDKIRFTTVSSTEPQHNYVRNYVPALGVPAADGLFTSGLSSGTTSTPEIPVGRIPALNSIELQNYLDKLIFYEADSLKEWKKKVLHVSGGNDGIQQTQFANQINANGNIIRGDFVGASVTSFNKNTTDAQQKDLRDKIVAVQNAGVSMVTFLGHASLTILDVDIGNIGLLENFQKYPFYYFNGCNVGNASEVDLDSTTGNISAKDYICKNNNNGAIAWLAHSNLTFDGNLYGMMAAFYNRTCISEYGKSVGSVMKSIGSAINPNDPIMRSHLVQWQLQGDPSLVVYDVQLPDLKVAANDLFTAPAHVTIQDDTFMVNVIVTNLGKTSADSVTIKIRHTLPSGTAIEWPSVKYKPVSYKDTFQYALSYVNPRVLLGNNIFEVTVDPEGNIAEGNELNNTASFTQFVAGGGVSPLLPVKYAIVNTDSVTLIGQNNNALTSQADYIFEIDTVPGYNSQAFRSSGVIQAGAIASWKIKLLDNDSQAYYWRVRLNIPVNEGGQWEYSSLSRIKNGGKGFAQVAFDQVKDVSLGNVVFTEPLHALEFPSGYKVVRSIIGRWSHSNRGVFDPYFNNPSAGPCVGGNGVVCVLFDGVTLRRKNDPDFPANCVVVTPDVYEFYTFSTKTQAGQDKFIDFLNAVKPGDYIGAFSFYDCGSDSWSPALRSKLQEMGLNKVPAIQNYNSAFTFIIKKGVPEESVEDTIYDDSNNAASTIISTCEKQIEGKGAMASFSTQLVGPSVNWHSCSLKIDSIQAEDKYRVDIYGVKENLTDTLVLSGSMLTEFNLSGIDADTYPFLKLKITVEDSINRSPVQVKDIIVNYDGPTELAVDASTQYSFYNDEIEQGDSIRLSLAIRNISDVAAGPAKIFLYVKDMNRVVVDTLSSEVPALAPGQFYTINTSRTTRKWSGNNELSVVVNEPRQFREVSYINNFMAKLFEVKTDNVNPVLDVTFDGYRIMNGDFVSPNPSIRITSKDNNKYLVQQDTSTFSLFLKTPVSADFERILFNDPNLRFTPASEKNNTAALEYKPEKLENGDYTLKVQSKDATGNIAGANDYQVDFKVVNESTITNFYPYPNPGTTNIRFVFTLTGSKAPERLLIRIMTVSGKIVKEITEQEFGPIKIGNNISEFGWDGTDNYGDRLANGVYLYQVFTRIDGHAIEKRQTAADKFVTHNTGKIYLLK
jgi:hypothetical protein